MRLRKLHLHDQSNEILYRKIAPFLSALGVFFAFGALITPETFGIDDRYQLIPYLVFCATNVAYNLSKAWWKPPLIADRIRVAVTILFELLFFMKVDPTRSLFWVALMNPFLGQVSFVGGVRENKTRFWLFTASTLTCFAVHYDGSARWAFISFIEIASILTVASFAWQVRQHERRQRRALLALYNRLAQKQKQLIQTERFAALGEFSTGIAHEINNALTVVVVGLEEVDAYLRYPEPPIDKIGQHVARMGRSANRIHRVVSQIRSLSRDARRDPATRFDLRTVIDDALFLVREQLKLARIDCRIELPPESAYIMGHNIELSQVVLNLLNNARDVLENQNGIRSLTVRVSKKGAKVFLEIQDTGTGIPIDVQNRMFNPFVTTKPVGKGTGLGLSISYGIVKRHQGEISFKTNPSGTTFIVELPLASEAAAA